MMGKATDFGDRSRRAIPDHVAPFAGNDRAFSGSEGARSRCRRAEWESGSTGRRISGLLAFLLILASSIALYEVAQTPRAFSKGANSLGTIRTIRNFYAGLDEFMETGDASAVSKTLAPGALAFAPEQGAMGEDSGLLTYLLALRSTYPQLRLTVEQIDAGGDIAVASVRRTGIAGVSAPSFPSASGTSQEFFRVRDGRIVEHWTTALGFALLHPLTVPPTPVTVHQPAHLSIAELTFSSSKYDLEEPIEGPALVIVQRGRLTLAGDGFSQILDLATGAVSVPGPHQRAVADPGQAIAIPDNWAFVWNDDTESATARIAILAENPPQILEYLPGFPDSQTRTINDTLMLSGDRTTTHGAVTVRPLAFDHRPIPNGRWELEIDWAVLGPGASLPLPDVDEWVMAHVLSGTASAVIPEQHDLEMLSTLTNDRDEPVVALVIRLLAAP